MKRTWITLMALLLCAIPTIVNGQTDEARQGETLPELADAYPGVILIRGNPDTNQIALTFDDGPDPRFTETVLNTLEDYGVQATFFVIGERAEANPDYIRRIQEEGHELGNHTFSHPNLTDLTADQMQTEIEQTDEIIEQLVGYRPTLFRPPYGMILDSQMERLEQMGNYAVGWTVDPNDWQEISAEEVTERVLADTTAGGVILLHDGVDEPSLTVNSPEALNELIPRLQQAGFQFVTVAELFEVSNEK
ncbi:polysaccharide deacetylase family protein [Geomicrobium sp. JSM 1781026]|uniref:polysaccharide deacetylase family protein n=2 Tax=unclassified Geomicrobium TaxID=2628951 RepID=UPI0035C15FA2